MTVLDVLQFKNNRYYEHNNKEKITKRALFFVAKKWRISNTNMTDDKET